MVSERKPGCLISTIPTTLSSASAFCALGVTEAFHNDEAGIEPRLPHTYKVNFGDISAKLDMNSREGEAGT